jgi:hypothetical protein
MFNERSVVTLVFVHIPKTAGRTLNQVALSAAPGSVAVVDTEEQLEMRLRASEDSGSLRYVGGHFRLTFAKQLINETMRVGHCKYVSLLREPVARAYSFYLFLLRVKTAIPHVSSAIVGRDFEYFLDVMYENGEWQLRDGQCWLLCGERSAEQAIKAVATELDLLGITEDFDRFYANLRLISEFPFPPNISAHKSNVAPRADAAADVARGHKLENWREQVSTSALRKLQIINRDDFALYEYVKRRGGLIVKG